jgi:hypothetical protein
MSPAQISSLRLRPNPWAKRLDRLIALVVILNVGLVLFDLSYIRFRDLYLRYLPQLTQRYDPIKGIEPFRDTAQYLAAVDNLAKLGINNPATGQQLSDLRDRSVAMIEEDPFRIANKSGSLEKLKRRMRQHMKVESAKESFRRFWSFQHLNSQNWPAELAYFNRNFRPAIAANYYRPLDESGDFVDRFWQIDVWFIGFFAVDIAARVFWIRRRYRKSWQDAVLWRWYDLLLLLPFWRILRLIPLTARLHQVGWIRLQAIQKQVNRNLAENIAGEVTELVFLQVFRVAQSSIRQGALRQLLKEAPKMAEINEVDEVSEIIRRLLNIVSQTVLPNIEPELEQVVEHIVQQAIAQAPLSKSLSFLPGLEQLSAELSKQVTHQSLQALQTVLAEAVNDAEGQKLFQKLGQSSLTHLQSGLSQQKTLEEIEQLSIDWIEELKLTLVQRLEAQDRTQVAMEAESIRQIRKPEILPPASRPSSKKEPLKR